MTAIGTKLRVKGVKVNVSKIPSLSKVKSILQHTALIFFILLLGWICIAADNQIFQGKAIVAAIYLLLFFAFSTLAKD
jgi:membrane-bound ClpP family serine protease